MIDDGPPVKVCTVLKYHSVVLVASTGSNGKTLFHSEGIDGWNHGSEHLQFEILGCYGYTELSV